VVMTKCRRCENTTNFNVWCVSRKVMEVEIGRNDNLIGIVGDPENDNLRTEEISIADGDIEFAMVNCAWCGSDDIDFEKRPGEKNVRDQ
jgi:hypothetical protein